MFKLNERVKQLSKRDLVEASELYIIAGKATERDLINDCAVGKFPMPDKTEDGGAIGVKFFWRVGTLLKYEQKCNK